MLLEKWNEYENTDIAKYIFVLSSTSKLETDLKAIVLKILQVDLYSPYDFIDAVFDYADQHYGSDIEMHIAKTEYGFFEISQCKLYEREDRRARMDSVES